MRVPLFAVGDEEADGPLVIVVSKREMPVNAKDIPAKKSPPLLKRSHIVYFANNIKKWFRRDGSRACVRRFHKHVLAAFYRHGDVVRCC